MSHIQYKRDSASEIEIVLSIEIVLLLLKYHVGCKSKNILVIFYYLNLFGAEGA